MFFEEFSPTIADPVECVREIVSASVFRQGNLFEDIGVNQLLKVLLNRGLTLA